MHSSAIAISRSLPEIMPNPTEEALDEFKRQFQLSSIIVIPSRPENSSHKARRKWFIDFAYRLPPSQVSDIARKILGAEYNTLTRGENDEFFYVYPVSMGKGKFLLILSTSSKELAYLDDSASMVLTITIISTLLIIFIYYLLSRYIFRPFRKLRQQALESGRIVVESGNDADAVADDYRAVISELKDKEQKLIELNMEITQRAASLEQFNDHLLKSTNSGIVTLDREGRVLTLNDAAAQLLDIEADIHIGEKHGRMFDIKSDIGRALKKVIETRENQPYKETLLTSKNGKRRTVGFSVSTVSDDQQQPIGASVVINDVDEIVKLRIELELKNRMAALGEMSGGLAHQLRNSIGSIVGFSNLLKKQLANDRIESNYFEDLFSEVKETESLVKRFLGFARPLEYQPQRTNLSELVREVVSSFRQTIISKDPKSRLTFKFESNSGAVNHEVDALLLKQALNNILENAAGACGNRKGDILVTIESREPDISISIRDNGEGIPEDELDQIFTPFFSSKPSGTGLGLPLAGKIINLHGGHITVESKVGVGTTFRIHLPVEISAESPAAIRS